MTTVASVDYPSKRIYLSASTVGVDLDTMQVYRDVRALRATTQAHRAFKPMIIAGGNVQKLATTYTQPYVQLLYGCRIVPYDAPHNLRLIRDTFTDDGNAGVDCFDRSSLTSNVNIDLSVLAVEVREVNTAGGAASDPAEIAAAVWSSLTNGSLTAAQTLTLLAKLARNKTITNPTTGAMTVYDDDGTTVLFTAELFQDAGATIPYSGKGAERRERFE